MKNHKRVEPEYVFLCLAATLVWLLAGLEVRGQELESSALVSVVKMDRPSNPLAEGMRLRWMETEPPKTLIDRCTRVEVPRKGHFRVEMESTVMPSGLWVDDDSVRAHVVGRTVGVRFAVCRAGFVTVCETSTSALGPVVLSLLEEEPDPLEQIVDEDPIRIDRCNPQAAETR